MLNELKYTLKETENQEYYMEYKGHYFKIDRHSYQLLVWIKEGWESPEIARCLNVDLTEINQAMVRIENTLTHHHAPKIKRLFTVLNNDYCQCIGKWLGFLFEKKYLYWLAGLSVVSVFLFYLCFGHYSFLSLPIGITGYLPALMIIMFFHEMGHVCAASHFHLEHLKIEAGVYYMWPVFYVALHQQVLLPREKRIIVSAAGLYFQMLLALICICCHLLFPNNFTILMIHLDLALLVMNAFPVLILDGYWIYADLCRIENLDTKAKALLKMPLSEFKNLKQIPVALKIYAVIRLLTLLLIWFTVACFLISNLKYFPDMVESLKEGIGFGIIARTLLLVLPYLFFITYLSKIIYGRLSKHD